MSNNIGSKLYSIDFHVHTPASGDYKDKNATATDIISRAVEVGLDALVIVDHNTCAWIDILRQAAENKGITIFPGFEVNTSGGHILGVFDPQAKMDEVETALIRCGIDKKDFGNETALGLPIEEVINTIGNNGGIAIGAHIDKEKGFLKVVDQGVAIMRIYKNPKLSAVEITEINSKDDYISGKFKGTGRIMACVQGSDAHSLQKIGDKITFLKANHLSLEGLRQAFTEPAHRIKFPSEVKEINYPHIIKIMVSQGFLAKQEIFFNAGFNCIVGGAGTGKSTIIEFIRFALNQVSSIPEIADDCEAKVKELAKNGAKIYVQLKSETGEMYMICRTYDGDENPISIGKHLSKEPVNNIEIRNLFRVHAFSQGEAISIARNPLAQLDLIDNHLNLNSYKREIENTYNAIREQKGIVVLQGKTANKDAVEKEKTANELQLKGLMSKLNSLEEAQKNPIIQSHQLWSEENDYFQQLHNLINSTRSEIINGVERIDFPIQSVSKLSSTTPNIEKISKLILLLSLLTESKQKAKELLLDTLKNIDAEIDKTFTEWELLYKTHSEEYQKLEESAPFEKIKEITNQIKELKTAIRKNDLELSNIQSAQKTLDELLLKRKEYKGIITDQKARIRTLREKKAREFSERLKGSVRIRLIPDGNIESYESFIATSMKGQYMSKDLIKQLCKTILPWELADFIRDRNDKKITELSHLDERRSKKIVEVFNSHAEFIIDLEAVYLEDLLEIEYKVNENIFKPLDKLSTGQKATVIVLISMIEGIHPVLFDQPEDALYTPFIYKDVVQTLRAEKESRQFIFATHNSNLAVGGDTDLSIVLDGTSDQTEIAESGGLDDKGTRDAMLLVLEGGEEALRVRIGKSAPG